MRKFLSTTLLLVTVLAACMAGGALAQPQTADAAAEIERLQQCDRTLCGIALNPQAPGAALQCDIAKTWPKEDINTAWSKKNISWPFGDARCAIKLHVDRTVLTGALTNQKYMLKVPGQTVSCEVDREGKRYPVIVTLAPHVEFKDGKATTVWLNVDKIEGNVVIRNVVWAAAKMEANFGVFQKDFLKGINDYVGDYCQKTYGKPL